MDQFASAITSVLSFIVPLPIILAVVCLIVGLVLGYAIRARQAYRDMMSAPWRDLQVDAHKMMFRVARLEHISERLDTLSNDDLLADGGVTGNVPSLAVQLAESHRELAALAERAGRLIYQIPERMVWKEFSKAEVRIGTEEMRGFMTNMLHPDLPVAQHDVSIVEQMSVRIRGEADCFAIACLSEQTQFIGRPVEAASAFQHQEFGKWIFEIKPLKLGKQTLFVVVSGTIAGKHGAAPRELPPKEFSVSVRVGLRSIFGGFASWMWWTFGLLVGGVVGAAVSDVFPEIKRSIGMDVHGAAAPETPAPPVEAPAPSLPPAKR